MLVCLPATEVEITYQVRPVGFESKPRSFANGWRILRSMMVLLKDNKPFLVFGWLAICSLIVVLGLGVPVIVDFARTGLAERLPSALLATGLAVVGLAQLAVGLILDTLARARVEAKRIAYLQTR